MLHNATFFKQRSSKFAILIFVLLVSVKGLANEPDSAYLFAYATNVRDGKNGLHFAWSIDKESWMAIGPEYSYVKSDYGRWDTEKRMIDPVLFQSADGWWHCIWSLNHTKEGALAYVTTQDLVYWGRQSYYAELDDFTKFDKGRVLAERSKQQEVLVGGKHEKGTVSKVPWTAIEGAVKAQQLATCKKQLWSEVAADDAVRFAGLQPVDITVAPQLQKSKKISTLLIGAFFEDLNYAADGGLYAELVQNRDFEYDLSDKVGRDQTWDSKKSWQATGLTFSIDTAAPIHRNNKHYAILQVGGQDGKLVNEGFDGIAVKAGEKYDFSIFARVLEGKGGRMAVRLTDKSGKIYGETFVKISSAKWKKESALLIAKATVADAWLEITPEMKGSLAVDMISLFPQKTFKGRKNGLREDLAQVVADMNPRFVRFPGGCLAHGDGIENMYRWKNTIGPLEARVPQRNIWNYHQTAGLGYFEYFQFCEDIGAEPLPVVAAGVPCQNSHAHHHPLGGQQGGIPLSEMDDYVQEVLDLIEWANGDAKTKWGKVRAEAGHPRPFNLKYVGVGNEDLISDVFEERFTMIFNAVKEKYPEIVVIGTVGPFFEGTDYVEGWKIAGKLRVPMVDEHYYVQPGWFIYNQDYYDKYDRSKSKVYLGEYASHVPGKRRNLEAALSEALYLTALERNGDVVSMSSYAPLLAKEGHVNWNPDLIYFTNTEVKPTVSYQVQKLFGNNSGSDYIPQNITLSNTKENVQNRIAVSVVKDDKTGDVILKMVNMLPVEVRSTVDVTALQMKADEVVKTVLQGKPADTNLQPVQSSISVKEVENMVMPPYSFTVVRIQEKSK